MNGVQRFENFEELLRQCGEYVTQVCGVSMYPMLRNRRDPVLIHPVEGDLEPYDVAVYSVEDYYVCHRVLEVRDDIYVIRGDNNFRKELVPKETVLGVVVGFWRFGKYIPVSNRYYRFYSRFWVAANPVLRPVLWVNHTIRRFASAVKRRVLAR